MSKPLFIGALAITAVLLGAAGIAQADAPQPSPQPTASAAPGTPATPSAPDAPDAALSPLPALTAASTPTRLGASSGLTLYLADTPYYAKLGSSYYFAGAVGDDDELWKVSSSGVKEVKNLWAGGSSQPGQFVTVGSWVYFTASNDGVTDQIWRTNGSSTQQLTHLTQGASSGDAQISSLTKLGSSLYFTANVYPYGDELWKLSGTTLQLIADIRAGASGSNPSRLTGVGSTLYFTANDGVHGEELWRTQGTLASTWMVKDINPGSSSGGVGELASYQNTLFITVTSDPDVSGSTLEEVASDGHSVMPVNAALQTNDANLTTAGNYLVFSGQDGTHGAEPWRTNGTPNGTALIADLDSGTGSSEPYDFVKSGSTTYFLADNTSVGTSIFKTTGTSATPAFTPSIAGETVSTFQSLLGASGKLFFAAQTTSTGEELWVTGGTQSSTKRLTDIAGGSSSSTPTPLFTIGSKVYFYTQGTSPVFAFWSVSY